MPTDLVELRQLDAAAARLELRIRHHRCCYPHDNISKLVAEWKRLQLAAIAIESALLASKP